MEEVQIYEADHSEEECAQPESAVALENAFLVDLLRKKEFTVDLLLQALFTHRAIVNKISGVKANSAKGSRRNCKTAHSAKKTEKAVSSSETCLAALVHRVLVDFYADNEFSFHFLSHTERLRFLQIFDALCGTSPIFAGMAMHVAHCILTQDMLRIIRSPAKFRSCIPNILKESSSGLMTNAADLLGDTLRIDGYLDFLDIPRPSTLEVDSPISATTSYELSPKEVDSCSLYDFLESL